MMRVTTCSYLLLVVLGWVGVQGQSNQVSLRDGKDRPMSPAIHLADSGGKAVSLSEFRGRPVVVNFWATECGGCREELPTFVKLSQTYKDQGLTVVGVSMDIMYSDLKNADEGWAHVRPFVASHGMTYPIVLDDGTAEKSFNITALPATFLIDRSGRVAATYSGVVVDPANVEANVKALLAER